MWEYRGARPEEFRARGRGTVQGLAEGNVLVANPEAAESFEITRAGEIVWRFRSARLHPADNSTVVSAQRCTPEQLARLSAVPAGPR